MAEKPHSTDPLRAEAAMLLSQARAQSIEIQRALAAVHGDGALQSRLSAMAAQASGVARQISQALNSSGPLHEGDLVALESIMVPEDTGALLTEATAGAIAGNASAQSVAAASAATRQQVQTLSDDVFEKRIFDPYLHFSSAEDEADFRKRQAAARKYVDEQLARGTPEGNLNAAGGMQGTLLDADAHGAGASPEFMPRWDALADDARRQRTAMQAAGQSTAEYDRDVTASARRFLKAKGLSDAEIDKRLAASADPLDAVKPFLGSARDDNARKLNIAGAAAPTASTPSFPRPEATEGASGRDAQLGIDFGAMDAKLQAAGLQSSGTPAPTGHGLAMAKPSGRDGQGVAG